MHPDEVKRRLKQDKWDDITVSALFVTLSLFTLGASIQWITNPTGKALGATISGFLFSLFVICLINSIRR